jgi:peroxiredoxin
MNNLKFKIQNSRIIFCFLLFAFCFFSIFAQKTIITGKIENNKFTQADLRLLYKEDGVSFGTAKINADGTFKLTANLPKTDLYKLVFADGQHVMMSLLPNQNIELVLDAEDLSSIKSVKGSPSIEFTKNVAGMFASLQTLIDSINNVLRTDKDVLFYNEFQSQFKPFSDANAETDAFGVQVARITDSLQRFVNSKLIKGKVDNKEIDVFIYTSSNFLKNIVANYTKYKNYVYSMSLFYDFKNNRNPNFESFYTSSVDKYLDLLNQRDTKIENTFSGFVAQAEVFLAFRDSLHIHDLAVKKKEKDLLVAKIIQLSEMPANVKDAEINLLSYARAADGYAKYTLQEAQRNVSSIVQKYQTFFDNEREKRNDVIMNLLLANKNDLAVLMFIDLFPRDQHAALHQEIIKALHAKHPDHPIVAERYKIENAPATSTSIGAMAPDIALANPDGQIMRLSDLRGKVVLLDFWAAWCRPCRIENPNVVRAYKKYHDKGFEVFSVSLDRDKASWVKAIKDDELIWPYHVSDLKYWQSEAAKIYGVSGIPATFLIGKDGRIIAKNLRGAALENALKELFE